jgi:hypothetical protein
MISFCFTFSSHLVYTKLAISVAYRTKHFYLPITDKKQT